MFWQRAGAVMSLLVLPGGGDPRADGKALARSQMLSDGRLGLRGGVLPAASVAHHQAEKQVNSSVFRAAGWAVDIGVAGGGGYVSRVAGVEPA